MTTKPIPFRMCPITDKWKAGSIGGHDWQSIINSETGTNNKCINCGDEIIVTFIPKENV